MKSDAERLNDHWGAMVRTAHSVLGDRTEAEECAAHALAQVYEQRPDDVLNMEAYLVTVAKRRAIDRLRGLERCRRRDARLSVQESAAVADVAEDVVRQAEARWMAAEAERLLAPPIFTLLRRVADGDDVAIIASDLGLTKSSAHTHLHRARKLLRGVYAKALAVLALGWLGLKRSALAAPVVLAAALVLAPALGAADDTNAAPTTPALEVEAIVTFLPAARPAPLAVPKRQGRSVSRQRPTSAMPVPPPVARVAGPWGVGVVVEQRHRGTPEQDGVVKGALGCVRDFQVAVSHIGC